jgi:predicted ATPase with chaperone activity
MDYHGDSQKPCSSAHSLVTRYQKRISGPLLDRIDIHIEVPRVDYEELNGDRVGKSSECIRARVQAARDRQRKHFSKNSAWKVRYNLKPKHQTLSPHRQKSSTSQNNSVTLSRMGSREGSVFADPGLFHQALFSNLR